MVATRRSKKGAEEGEGEGGAGAEAVAETPGTPGTRRGGRKKKVEEETPAEESPQPEPARAQVEGPSKSPRGKKKEGRKKSEESKGEEEKKTSTPEAESIPKPIPQVEPQKPTDTPPAKTEGTDAESSPPTKRSRRTSQKSTPEKTASDSRHTHTEHKSESPVEKLHEPAQPQKRVPLEKLHEPESQPQKPVEGDDVERKEVEISSKHSPPKKSKTMASPKANKSENNSKEASVKANKPSEEVARKLTEKVVVKVKKQPDSESIAALEARAAAIKRELSLEDDDDESPLGAMKRQTVVQSRSCPYLDTINRNFMDFDFEKLCSVSLSHLNVYACLVCGKYFQGRGNGTHAYTHSVDIDHRVFLNLTTLKFYCLPDNYEILDSSLDDIKYVVKPTFTKELIGVLEKTPKLYRAFDGSTYHPGVVGLNNIKANDYCNVVLHALSHIIPIRHYFLREENYAGVKRVPGDNLVLLHQRFGELLRKLWNPRAFKAHVSPHEMLQAVVLCSQKRFQITQQGDAIEFLSWFLNTLHLSLNGTKKTTSSVVFQTFRGRMRVYSRKVLPTDSSPQEQQRLLSLDEYKEQDEDVPFLYLTLDLPSAPLYRDELLQNIIPQIPLGSLLGKFSGDVEKEYKTYNENVMKRFQLTRLPPFLILFVKRFTKNTWFVEKNPTIVNFPIKNVDMWDYLSDDAKSVHRYTTYDLVANVVHDGKPEKGQGSYRIQLFHNGTGKWFELEDLHVKDILPQMIPLTETYIQFWELNTKKTREERSGEEEEKKPSTEDKPMEH